MEQKERKIKEKKCKCCNKYFVPPITRPLQAVCSIVCSVTYNRNLEEKKKEKEWNKRKSEIKEDLKTLSDYKKDLETEINHIVRLIDKGHECISSGLINYQVNAGHLYSVGSYPALRFNLLNIYAQSVHDNLHKGGNGVRYKERIKEVFGNEVSEEIEELKIKYPELKLTIPELKEKIKIAKEMVKSFKKIVENYDIPFSNENRIIIRRKLNNELGIYL